MPPDRTRNTRSIRAQLALPAASHAPSPRATKSRSPSCGLLVSCTARKSPPPDAATIATGRSLPRPSRSSYGTHVHTISPGSGSPSRDGVYARRTPFKRRGSTSTVADGPACPGESNPVETDVDAPAASVDGACCRPPVRDLKTRPRAVRKRLVSDTPAHYPTALAVIQRPQTVSSL